MNRPLKITLITFGVLALGGTIWYLVSRNKDKGDETKADPYKGKRATFVVDGYVYKTDKTQGYAKKSGEWGGIVEDSISDADFYTIYNSKGVKYLVKKSEVKLEDIKS